MEITEELGQFFWSGSDISPSCALSKNIEGGQEEQEEEQ